MIFLSLLFNLLFFFPSSILSISEDQFGEFDWVRKNIGYIDKIVYQLLQNKSIFVSTTEDILASVNIRTGELEWRVLLPKESSVGQLVADKSSLYTLSSQNGLLQAWSTTNGDLQWSQSLHSAKFPILSTPQSNRHQALSLDSNVPITPLGLIYALYRDCFFAISPLKGQIITQFCPNLEIPSHLMTAATTAMIAGASGAAGKKQFVLSEVITHPQKVIYNQPYPIVIGSIQTHGNDGNDQSKHFILSISIQNRALTLTEINPLASSSSFSSSVAVFHSPQQQHSFYSSSFDPTDATFTLTSLTTSSVFTLDLSSTLPSFSSVFEKDYSVRTHSSLVFGNTVVEICYRSSVSFAADQVCVFLGIQQDVTASATTASWVAKELHTCRGHRVYTSAEEDSSAAAMKSGVIKNLLCLTIHSPTSSSSSEEVQVTLLSPSAVGKYSITHFTLSSSTLSSSASLSHLSFSTYLSKTTSSLHTKLLMQSSSGTLSLIQQGSSSSSTSAVVRWSREESLAHVKQGVILDNTLSTTVAVLHGANGGLTSIPSFSTRLIMQLEDLQSKLFTFQSSLHSLPSTFVTLVHDLLPPPLAASLMPTYRPPSKNNGHAEDISLFGFNKMSVQLTSRCAVDGSQLLSMKEFSDCANGFKIVALDLVTGATLWSFSPDIISSLPLSFFLSDPSSSSPSTFSLTANLLKIRLHSRANHPAELGLVISIERSTAPSASVSISPQSALLSYQFHALTGKETSSTHRTCDTASGATAGEGSCPEQSHGSDSLTPLRSADRVVMGAGHVQSIQFVDTHLFERPLHDKSSSDSSTQQSSSHHHQHTQQHHYQHSTQHYLLLHSSSHANTTSAEAPRVSLFPPLRSPHVYLPSPSSSATGAGAGGATTLFTHSIQRHSGQQEGLTSYQVNLNDYVTLEASPVTSTAHPLHLYSLQPIGQLVFSTDSEMASDTELFEEHIVTVVYPQPHEPIHQMAKVLGDDSLLLKYLNPHMAVLVTEKRLKGQQRQDSSIEQRTQQLQEEQETDSMSSSSSSSDSGSGSSGSGDEELFVTVIDVVSAQIIYRGSLLHASQPVSVSLLEHTIAVSYWNSHAQRFELSSIHLYEGMIGKYGLGPTSSSMDATRSAFNAPPPIALQKSFILPRGVTAMHHTVTERGITNKNLLIGLSTGQLLSLDTRAIDPRRPLGAPSQLEKEEGLMQYIPFLLWSPLQILSVNTTLPAIETILSSSSHLESTSLVLSYGIDIFFTRATPSKGFDMLASDFNKPLLALIVGGMAVVVWLLKNYNSKRILNKQWL